MELKELVTARMLMKHATGKNIFIEATLLEVSPSGKFAKLKSSIGNEFWMKSAEIEVLEILDTLPL